MTATQTPQQARSTAAPNLVAPAGAHSSPADQGARDDQRSPVGGGTKPETGAKHSAAPERHPRPSLFDPAMFVLAQFLDDIEGLRKAQDNRRRILTATEPDDDGVVRGFGLSGAHPVVATIEGLSAQLGVVEHDAILALNRTMRRHPLGAWQKEQRGVGEKQFARLLAAIGDPYINGTTGQPRTVSQLWAYSGLHTLPAADQCPSDAQTAPVGSGATLPAGAIRAPLPNSEAPLPGTHAAARRQKGVRANWSTEAKTRAWLIVQSCMKQLDAPCKTDTGIANHVEGCACSPYRIAIDERRKHTSITHPEWTPGHSLNDAMRVASKRLLRDLWRAARDLHNAEETQQ